MSGQIVEKQQHNQIGTVLNRDENEETEIYVLWNIFWPPAVVSNPGVHLDGISETFAGEYWNFHNAAFKCSVYKARLRTLM